MPRPSADEPRRNPSVVGVSLKMYFDAEQTVSWSSRVAELVQDVPELSTGEVELFVLPSLPVLPRVLEIFAGTPVGVGAQDLFWEDRGPYTGAVSGADLAEMGCRYVEIGHAERRALFGEDDRTSALKVAAAVRNGLIPVLCVGEPDRVDADVAAEVCITQLHAALSRVENIPRLVVAYEPVWAIGKADAASAEHVGCVAGVLRSWLREQGHPSAPPIIYGGSAGVGLLPTLAESVDGLFLGRFAHDPEALRAILREAAKLQRWRIR